jgi:hypothetical protein
VATTKNINLTTNVGLQSGFFLVHYAKMYQEHIGKLYNLYSSGKLKVTYLHKNEKREYEAPVFTKTDHACDGLADLDRPNEVCGSPFGG